MKQTFLILAFLVTGLCTLQARVILVADYSALYGACTNALPGDTILIAPGIYTITNASRIMITSRPGPVLVRGTGNSPWDVIVEGAGQDSASVQMNFNLDNSPRWTFENLTTRNSYYHGFKFDHNSTDCVLRHVVMRDHGESGVKGTSDPALGTYPDRLLIEDCDIGFTNTGGGTRSVCEGIDGVGVNDWIIRHSRFVNIQKDGREAYAIFTKGNSSNTIIEANRFENCFIGASFGGGGTDPRFFRDSDQTYEHRGGIIRNNVMIHCTDAGVYVNKGKDARIYNNTLFECELTLQIRFTASSGWIRNNLVVLSPDNPNEPLIRVRDGATLLAGDSNRIVTASEFRKTTGADSLLDLHLLPASSARNAGVNLHDDVPLDLDGNMRRETGFYDLGAYEYKPQTGIQRDLKEIRAMNFW